MGQREGSLKIGPPCWPPRRPQSSSPGNCRTGCIKENKVCRHSALEWAAHLIFMSWPYVYAVKAYWRPCQREERNGPQDVRRAKLGNGPANRHGNGRYRPFIISEYYRQDPQNVIKFNNKRHKNGFWCHIYLIESCIARDEVKRMMVK